MDSRFLLQGDPGRIVTDTTGNEAGNRSPVVSCYVPDVYVRDAGPYRVILGEAETERSVDSRYAMEQIKAFARHCMTVGNSLLVVAVPWQCVASVKNAVARWGRKERLDVSYIKVLDCYVG